MKRFFAIFQATVICVLISAMVVSASFAAKHFWVSNEATLSAITGMSAGDQAIVGTSDGVSSFYYYNGSTWVKSSVSANGVAGDDIISKETPRVDVRAHGAVPNDNSASAASANWTALRAAYTVLAADNTGGTIYFPAGTWWFTAGDNGVQVSQLGSGDNLRGIRIVGERQATTLRAAAGGARLIDIVDNANPEIADLRFVGWLDLIHASNGVGHLIDAYIHDNWLTDFYGAISTAKTTSTIYRHNTFDVFWRNAIRFVPGSSNNTVETNYFYDSENDGYDCSGVLAGRGISIEGTNIDNVLTEVSNIDLIDNRFYFSDLSTGGCGNTFTAIAIDGAKDIHVRGGQASDIKGSGIRVGDTAGCRDIDIEGFKVPQGLASIAVDGISINNTNNYSVSLARIYKPGQAGIRVVGGVGSLLGNEVDGSVADSGFVVDNVNKIKVVGNSSSNNLRSGYAFTNDNRVTFGVNDGWNNDSASTGGTTDNNYAGVYINGGADFNLVGNTLYVTGAGTFSHNLIHAVGSAARVRASGNYLFPFRTADIYVDGTVTFSYIDNTPVGSVTPSSGKFTTLQTTDASTFGGDTTISDGSSSYYGDNTSTRFRLRRDSGTGRFVFSTEQTGAAMTDTDAIYTLIANSAGGTLDPGQRVFQILNYLTSLFYVDAAGNVVMTGELTAAGYASSGMDNTFRWNVHNTGHPDTATLEVGDCYTTASDNTLRCSWDGNSPGTNLGGGSMVYPGAGVAVSTGSAWGTSKASPTGDIVGTSDSQIFTNKTLDVNATGNVLKQYGYMLLYPRSAGSTATYNDTVGNSRYQQVLFGNAADKANNCAWYYTNIPEDLDSSVDLSVKFKFQISGGADTGTHYYEISMEDIPDSDAWSTVGDTIALTFAGDGAGADFDLETIGWTTLTGWKTALTPGAGMRLNVCRDGDNAGDSSTVDSYTYSLTIRYGRTQ